MRKKIIDYSEFILESKIELLLEANIKYTDKFKGILDEIDSPISTKLKQLSGKEVDVNTNYIDINTKSKDTILFTPDSKTLKIPTTILEDGYSYSGAADRARRNGYPIKNIDNPERNQEVEVVKELSSEELANFFGSTGYKITHIKFINQNSKEECETFYDTNKLSKDISEIKQSEVKVGRFATSILTKAGLEFKPTEIEDFVSKYKTAIQIRNDIFKRFEIVSGDDIKKFYNEEAYYERGGTLGGSCMRYSKCANFLNIYSKNPDKVSLIILKSDKDPEKIIGRAILWTDDKDRRFMDRVYIINHANQTLFVEYAIKNGFYYKKNQTYSEGDPIMFNGQQLSMEDSVVTVELKPGSYYEYPYADTLKYYDTSTGYISNDDSMDHDCTLTDTEGGDGSCDTCGGRGTLECEDCDGRGEYECGECDGRGNTSCSDCYGDGDLECGECEGSGREDCDDCNSTGENPCSTCDGTGTFEGVDGEQECEDCGGTGNLVCDTCNGDCDIECRNCNGNGKTKCDECDGEGDIECSECGGEGEQQCGSCDGEGNRDCYECR
jgi:hypothetical protein